MSLKKTTRFNVFKRDNFTCGYCGKRPPLVILEIDHITPIALDGGDEIDNLITSCFDCNRGKRDIPLSTIPPKISENLSIAKEAELQLKEFRKVLDKKRKRIEVDIKTIDKIFMSAYNGWTLSDDFKRSSLKIFIEKLPLSAIEDAMYTATSKFKSNYQGNRQNSIKYFCGICWNLIKREGTSK